MPGSVVTMPEEPSDAGHPIAGGRDGNSLCGPRYLVGRRLVGGEDCPLPNSELDALAEAAFGACSVAVAAREIGGFAGRVVRGRHPVTGEVEYDIFLARDLPPGQRLLILAHEIGHVMADMIGPFPTDELRDELEPMYHELNTGEQLRRGETQNRDLAGPVDRGYQEADTASELWAEGFRAYLLNPNYIKTVENLAARLLRAAANGRTALNPVIMLNSVAAFLVLAFVNSPGA
jgi:hypothetical protein